MKDPFDAKTLSDINAATALIKDAVQPPKTRHDYIIESFRKSGANPEDPQVQKLISAAVIVSGKKDFVTKENACAHAKTDQEVDATTKDRANTIHALLKNYQFTGNELQQIDNALNYSHDVMQSDQQQQSPKGGKPPALRIGSVKST